MKRPLIKGKDFSKLPLDNENKFKEGSWEAYQKRSGILCVFLKQKRRRMNVWAKKKKISMWTNVIHEKNVCKKIAWKEIVCSK